MTQEDAWNSLRIYTWAKLRIKYYNFANDFAELVSPTDAETMWDTVRAADFATLKSYWVGAYRTFSYYWPPTLENIIITDVEIDYTTTFPVLLGDYGDWEVTITNTGPQMLDFGSGAFELYFNEKRVQSLPSPGSINPGQTYSFWMVGKYIDLGDTKIKVKGPGNEFTYEYIIRVTSPPDHANVALLPWTLRVEPITIPLGESVITIKAQVKNHGGETGSSNFQVAIGLGPFQNEFYITMQPGEVKDLSIKVWVDLPNAGTIAIRAKMEGESELVAQMFDIIVMESVGSLLFIVNDAENNLPLQGVLVKIETVGFMGDRFTDVLGRGEFNGLQNGEYGYTLFKEGYKTLTGSIIVFPGPQTTKSIILERTVSLPEEIFVRDVVADKTDVVIGGTIKVTGATKPYAVVTLWTKDSILGYFETGTSVVADKNGYFEMTFSFSSEGGVDAYVKACLIECVDSSYTPMHFVVSSAALELFVTVKRVDKTSITTGETIMMSGISLPGAVIQLYQHIVGGELPGMFALNNKLEDVGSVTAKAITGEFNIEFTFLEAGMPSVFVQACLGGECVHNVDERVKITVTGEEIPEIMVTSNPEKISLITGETAMIYGETSPGAKVVLWHQKGLDFDDETNFWTTADSAGYYEINFQWEEAGDPKVYVKACKEGACADTSGEPIQLTVVEGEVRPPGTITERLRIWRSEEVWGDDEKVFTVAWDGDLVDANIHIEVSTVIPQTVVFYLNDIKIVQDGIYYPHSVSYDVNISEYLVNGINTIRFDAGTFAIATSLFGYVDVSILGEFTKIGEPEPGFFDQYKTPLLVGGGILALYVLLKASKAAMPSITIVSPSKV